MVLINNETHGSIHQYVVTKFLDNDDVTFRQVFSY